MEKKETKLIILLVILALVWGAIYYFFDADEKDKFSTTNDTVTDEIAVEETITQEDAVINDTNQVATETEGEIFCVNDDYATSNEFKEACARYLGLQDYERDKTKWTTYHDEEYGFSLKFPDRFEVIATPDDYTHLSISQNSIKDVKLDDLNVSITIIKKEDFEFKILHTGNVNYKKDTDKFYVYDYDNVLIEEVCDWKKQGTSLLGYVNSLGSDDIRVLWYATGDTYYSLSAYYVNTTNNYMIVVKNGEGFFGNRKLADEILETFKLDDPSIVKSLAC